MLDPSVRGGLLAPDDGSVDPRLLAAALLQAARGRGRPADPAARRGDQLQRPAGRPEPGWPTAAAIAARWIVLAAGWQSADARAACPPASRRRCGRSRARSCGCGPARGAAARRAAAWPAAAHRARASSAARASTWCRATAASSSSAPRRRSSGRTPTVTAGGIWELLRDARTLVPGITELELADAVAGLRPGTPDNAPVLGPAGLPGLVLATGHFRAGVLLAPVTADTVAAYLRTGTPDPLWQAFGAGALHPARLRATGTATAGHRAARRQWREGRHQRRAAPGGRRHVAGAGSRRADRAPSRAWRPR